MQKSSIQCTVAAVDSSCLLSSVWYSKRFNHSARTISICLYCKGTYGDFIVLKLVTKSDSLLLEDQRGKASSLGHSQEFLLLIELVHEQTKV